MIFLNGQYLPKSDARLSPDDRGFIFGDGVYEVFRAIDGDLFEAARHQSRLESGLHALRIGMPSEASAQGVAGLAARLLSENELLDGEATLYVQVTRGAAPRAHAFPPADTAPSVYAFVARLKSLASQRENGVAAITQPDIRWLRCDIKTIQLLPNVLAKQAAVEAGAFDAIFVRDDGFVTEGTHTNVFAVVDGVLRTHPTSPRILPGVTRELLLECAAALGIVHREDALRSDELHRADELFFSGTTTDALPIVRLDGRVVGDGRPGPVARRLHSALMARMADRRRAAASALR